jgi:hypothetical protein
MMSTMFGRVAFDVGVDAGFSTRRVGLRRCCCCCLSSTKMFSPENFDFLCRSRLTFFLARFFSASMVSRSLLKLSASSLSVQTWSSQNFILLCKEGF